MIRQLFTVLIAASLSACAATGALNGDIAHHPEARPYSASTDAMGAVDAALARAEANGRLVLLVMGANWCHDSRALAGWLQQPRFAALVREHCELVFVDAGMPQTGKGANIEVARRFGLNELPGTPNVLVIDADGVLLNPGTATSWRNAASRSEDEIYEELALLATTEIARE